MDLAKEDAAKIGLPPLKCPQNAPLVLYLVELAKDAQKQVEEGANDRWLVAVRRAAAENLYSADYHPLQWLVITKH